MTEEEIAKMTPEEAYQRGVVCGVKKRLNETYELPNGSITLAVESIVRDLKGVSALLNALSSADDLPGDDQAYAHLAAMRLLDNGIASLEALY